MLLHSACTIFVRMEIKRATFKCSS
ncbi:YihA family ribosome biogenesis GTP-binding protein, partial [Alistipes onderdonkii]